MGSGDVDAWLRHIHNTRVRWGLDVQHRKVNGLDAPDITAHTWKQLVDRTLLGALLPDAEHNDAARPGHHDPDLHGVP
jgi:exonuclease V gamma subunit